MFAFILGKSVYSSPALCILHSYFFNRLCVFSDPHANSNHVSYLFDQLFKFLVYELHSDGVADQTTGDISVGIC